MKNLGLLFVLVLVACGGKLDQGGDGGTTPDGSPPPSKDAQPTVDVITPPPTPSCTPMQGATSVGSEGSCQTSESWSCGDTKYSVDCSCPSAQCTCSQETANGGVGQILKEPNMCPGCSGVDLATLCGFPH